jgi:hypothetical protein
LHRRDAKGAKKIYSGNNEVSKKILETAMSILLVERGATVVSCLLMPLRTLRLCGEKQIGVFLRFWVWDLGFEISDCISSCSWWLKRF